MPDLTPAARARARALSAAEPGCTRCDLLIRRGRDPELRKTGAAAAVYAFVQHHIRDHGTTAEAVDGCEVCEVWATPPMGIAPHLASEWGLHHFVTHALGIVFDEETGSLHFADQPSAIQPSPRATR